MSEITPTQASMMVATPTSGNPKRNASWFEAMADAWGKALDNQANTISDMSNELVLSLIHI